MCIFCAAIPAVAAAGTAAHGHQREAARQANCDGHPIPKPQLPAAKTTLALMAALVIASVIYHTQLRV